MTTLATRLSDLATRIATECKAIRTLLNGNAVDNAALITAAKSNLVAAINEVKAQANALSAAGGATIDDAATTSTTQTYSIDKIVAELAESAAAVKAEILGGAGAAYDTLNELKALLDSEAGTLTAALGNRLRFDAAQPLTAGQKAQGAANLGAAALADTGTLDTNFVTTFETGLT